ncbi:MAG: hypothetical protein IKF71_05100 [Bacilli bacterium]|nr:hypothetical protein [Bacilli bacterium]
MNLIYVTTIINEETNEEIFVFIDLETGKKYLFKDKDHTISYENEELLTLLNQDEEYDLKQSTGKKVIAISGVINLISLSALGISLVKELSRSNLDYVLNREVPGYEISKEIDLNDSRNFIQEFSRNVSINKDYTDKEALVLQNGGEDFLEDWAYLFSEEEREELLYGIRSFKIDRNAHLKLPVVGTYYEGKIKIDEDHHNILTTTHEVIHGLFKHSSKKVQNMAYGFSKAIKEAITSTINIHYFQYYAEPEEETAYQFPREQLFKLSLLVDKEDIMKCQISHDTDVIQLVCDACPHVSKKEIVRYFSMLDANATVNGIKKYHLKDDYKEEMDEIYRKMYLDKYGIGLPKDLVITSDDFLSDMIEFYCTSYPCIYELPKEKFVTVENFKGLHPNDVVGYILRDYEPLLLLCDEKERDHFLEDSECVDYLYNKYYKMGSEEVDKYLQCLMLHDDSFRSFFELYVKSLNERDLSSSVYISSLKTGIDMFFQKQDGDSSGDQNRMMHYRELESILESYSSPEICEAFSMCFTTDLEFQEDSSLTVGRIK